MDTTYIYMLMLIPRLILSKMYVHVAIQFTQQFTDLFHELCETETEVFYRFVSFPLKGTKDVSFLWTHDQFSITHFINRILLVDRGTAAVFCLSPTYAQQIYQVSVRLIQKV